MKLSRLKIIATAGNVLLLGMTSLMFASSGFFLEETFDYIIVGAMIFVPIFNIFVFFTPDIKLSSNMKKYIYGTLVILGWLSFELFLKYSDIRLGGAPYAAAVLFWLWLFCKAIGRTVWGFKKIENIESG